MESSRNLAKVKAQFLRAAVNDVRQSAPDFNVFQRERWAGFANALASIEEVANQLEEIANAPKQCMASLGGKGRCPGVALRAFAITMQRHDGKQQTAWSERCEKHFLKTSSRPLA